MFELAPLALCKRSENFHSLWVRVHLAHSNNITIIPGLHNRSLSDSMVISFPLLFWLTGWMHLLLQQLMFYLLFSQTRAYHGFAHRVGDRHWLTSGNHDWTVQVWNATFARQISVYKG
jgi:hypothetical protein